MSRSRDRGELLVALARQALHEAVGGPPVEVDGASDRELERPGACFVTLTKDGDLRGCIGALEARRSLADDVRHNARAAALEDSRFPPVTASELDRIELDVSVLSPLEPVAHEDERDQLRRLRPGVDGLVIEHGAHRATYLPQVWKSLPEPGRFLRELKIKAGLHPDFWADDMRAWRFTVESFRERPLRAAATVRSLLESGADASRIAARLREEGVSPIEAIQALRNGLGISLRDAKSLIIESPTWSNLVEGTRALHEELERLLDETTGED